jgi:hypothetical protein
MIWDALPTLIGLAGLAWAYGSAGELHRANFRQWVAGHFERAKPLSLKLLIRTGFVLTSVLTVAIVYFSAREIYDFQTSVEPLARKEVFKLLVSVFNLLAYSAASFALFLTLFKPVRPARVPLVLTEGQPITISLRGEPDIEAFKEAIKKGITMTIGVENGELYVDAQNLDGFSFTKS